MRLFKYIFFSFLFSSNFLFAQKNFQNIDNKNIYLLLDELANSGCFKLNSCIKPYAKEDINTLLSKAYFSDLLNLRQKEEVLFYLNKESIFSDSSFVDFNLNKFFNNKFVNYQFKKDNFKLSIVPIWGVNSIFSKKNNYYHFFGGLSFHASKNNWSFYSNLTDNTMSEPITMSNFFSKHRGGNYKLWLNNDYSELRGGITYDWTWGNLSFLKEYIEWGDNFSSSNIFSARSPSFPLIKLQLNPANWLDFNYFHGWLVSEVVDSSRSYFNSSGNYRSIFHEKNIAANMYSISTNKNLIFSFGNSIIYSDVGGAHVGYLFPFFFYKSLDHTLNHNIDNQNAQMFFNFSCRSFKNLHFYSTLFIDEFKKSRINTDLENNFFSYKIGVRSTNLIKDNVSSVIEFTRTTPMTYKHYNQTTTFESNGYNLGHYLIDNSYELYYSFSFKPKYNLKFKSEYLYAFHADELEYSYEYEYNPVAIPILSNKTWDNNTISFSVEYQIFYNFFFSFKYQYSNISGYANEVNSSQYYLDKFTPTFMQGINNSIFISVNLLH